MGNLDGFTDALPDSKKKKKDGLPTSCKSLLDDVALGESYGNE